MSTPWSMRWFSRSVRTLREMPRSAWTGHPYLRDEERVVAIIEPERPSRG
jgi:hypothetical protein